MPTPTVDQVKSFLTAITSDGSINLSTLTKLPGGGTHDIYRSDQNTGLLLKIMRDTVGQNDDKLSEDLRTLDGQYSALYETFGESRCIIEKRSVQSIQYGNEPPQPAIVSVVPFDPCFGSEEKFGFDVERVELNEVRINSKRYLYETANRSLLGNNEKPSPYVIRSYPLLNKDFKNIFKLLDTEPSLKEPMKEFLTKYKSFYEEKGILLDTIGADNVLFYKTGEDWQFKLGSVIKHDTGALTKEMLEKIIKNPEIVRPVPPDSTAEEGKEWFKRYTSICFMPACIRALNACAEKVGIDKIIDIGIKDGTLDALAKIHLQLEQGMGELALNYAQEGKFSTGLELYRQYKPVEGADDTYTRGTIALLYWNFIKARGKESSRSCHFQKTTSITRSPLQ